MKHDYENKTWLWNVNKENRKFKSIYQSTTAVENKNKQKLQNFVGFLYNKKMKHNEMIVNRQRWRSKEDTLASNSFYVSAFIVDT